MTAQGRKDRRTRGTFGRSVALRLRDVPVTLLVLAVFAAGAVAAGQPAQSEASRAAQGTLDVSPAARRAIEQIYEGNPAAALEAAQEMEKAQPEDPLPYLIEAEARWWKLYCEESEIRYGMADVWHLAKRPEDEPYLAAAGRAVELGEDALKKKETAQAHLWAGMGYALEAQMRGLRGERRATARAGVKARKHLMRALALDPQLADADTGLGLYNYYVDTLSPIVKLLRFFLGIPGGSKQEGVRQLRVAMEHGQLTAVEARFYLARNLRNYDHDYAQALSVAEPLMHDYPDNPIFLLLVGNLEIELGRKDQAAAILRRIDQLNIPDAACAARAQRLARELLAAKPAL